MSLSSVIAVLLSFALFLGSIFFSTSNYIAFLNLPGMVMVIGGTLAAAYMSYQPRYINIALKSIWHALKKPKSTREGMNTEIMRIVKWAYILQKGGLNALENELNKTKGMDPLMRFMLLVVTGGHDPKDLRPMMETSVESTFERDMVPVGVLKMMAGASPAFGMIGTLVGLVIMLQGLGDDMAALGVGLAVALLTTLYGVVLARLVCLPAATKLQQRLEIDRFRNYLLAEGMIMLAEKRSPRFMQDRLNSFLDPTIHFDIDKQLRG